MLSTSSTPRRETQRVLKKGEYIGMMGAWERSEGEKGGRWTAE